MWVPIAVYVLYALGVLKPDLMDLSWLKYEGRGSLSFGIFDFLFQVLMVWTIPVALLITALQGRSIRWAWWVLGPLIVLALLTFFVAWGFSESGAAKSRVLAYGLCVVAGLAYLGGCLRHRDS